MWEVESCRLIYHVDLSKSNIVSVGHMPRLAHVVAASANGSLQFIDYRTRNLKQAWRVPHNVPGQTRVTAVDPINNELIALGTSAGVISLIDARTGMILSTWKAHDGEVSQLSFVEGDSLVSAGTDGSMFQWDVTKVVLKSSFKGSVYKLHCFFFFFYIFFFFCCRQVSETLRPCTAAKKISMQSIRPTPCTCLAWTSPCCRPLRATISDRAV